MSLSKPSGTATGPGTSNNNNTPTESVDSGTGTVYPPQRHAGKVGYGPQYHIGPTIGEKAKGYEEELMGHLTHNHELLEHGRMMVSGEIKRMEKEHDMINHTPFAQTEEKKDEHHKEKEKDDTVSPSGSHKAKEKKGKADVDDVKHID